jgi:hypothetical protein
VSHLKIKIPTKNLGWQRCAEGFNSDVKWLNDSPKLHFLAWKRAAYTYIYTGWRFTSTLPRCTAFLLHSETWPLGIVVAATMRHPRRGAARPHSNAGSKQVSVRACWSIYYAVNGQQSTHGLTARWYGVWIMTKQVPSTSHAYIPFP